MLTTEELNQRSFKRLIGKYFRANNDSKDIASVLELKDMPVHTMSKAKTFCAVLDNETYLPIETFLDKYIQLSYNVEECNYCGEPCLTPVIAEKEITTGLIEADVIVERIYCSDECKIKDRQH